MIIFCDKNEKIIKGIEKILKNTENKLHCDLIVSDKDDVLECKKDYPNAKIVTASNPDFFADGGLDLVLKNKYPEQWEKAREFNITNDLFFIISCNKDITTNEKIIKRALLGVYFASRKNDIILTGIGTSIAGLNIDIFFNLIKSFILADFRNTDFRNSYFNDSDFRNSDFRNTDFRNTDFKNSDFSNSDFCDSDFSYSNFRNSDFRNSDFRNTNFCDSDFGYSDFSYSDFKNSNFKNSDFKNSYFNNSDFSNTNFRYSDFRNTDFRNTDFSNTDFSYSDFIRSDFIRSDFSDSDFKNSKWNYRITPTDGKFIGWKKADNYIIKLEIQDATIVSGGFVGRKLRTNKVKVLEIQKINGEKSNITKIRSDYDEKFIYKLGKIIKVENFKKDDKIECDTGIHFFITRDEAINYII